MGSIVRLIEQHRDDILRGWRESAQAMTSARGLSRPEILNFVPAFLALLGRGALDATALTVEQQRLIENHLSHRLRQGYELEEILAEFALLGRIIAQLVDREPPDERPTATEVAALSGELSLTAQMVTNIFTKHLLEDEQRDKRYARLIADVAEESLKTNGRGAALGGRLREVLQLIMEAMRAQSASLLLVHAQNPEELIAVASAGVADEAMAHYVTAIDSDSFASRVAAAAGETLEISDVANGFVPVSETLRKSGIRSLLGVRLPARHILRGVLYIGLTEQRAFAPSELRRLAALGDRLTLHLDNAHLVAELRSRVSAVQMFVDVLAHDLRGPISSAKLAAELIDQDPASCRQRLPRLFRALDRASAMIGDLLDAHRVEAGAKLSLNMSSFDLCKVAQDVADDLNQRFPGRVVVQSPSEVRGTWSSTYLRRAMWNLAINGLRYGDSVAPVEIVIAPASDRVEIAVHNHGGAMSVATQQALFKMFVRGEAGPRSSIEGGWGLGLTLVRGAAEAHGGTIDVTSDDEHGTTFTMRIPRRAEERYPALESAPA